ncbi:MAG: histone deacetylase [Planctomycetota bacterium]
MTLLFIDPEFCNHRPPGRGDETRHPECPQRIEAIEAALESISGNGMQRLETGQVASDSSLLRVHTGEHLGKIQDLSTAGGGWVDSDTYVGEASDRVARLAAGTACLLVDRVVAGAAINAMLIARPPGHHATANTAMGFCIFNTIAVAAAHALTHAGIDRVLIVDFDVHHGNGTQDIFYRSDQVGFLSMHRENFYPHTGTALETGAGAGVGYNVNVPIPAGTPIDEQMRRFDESLTALADHVRPNLVLTSAGFDAHHMDPVGNLAWHDEHFEHVAQRIATVAQQYAGGRWVSVLEGGYHPPSLAESVLGYLHIKQQSETGC